MRPPATIRPLTTGILASLLIMVSCVPARPYYAARATQPATHPVPQGVRQRVVLLGDAGAPAEGGEPVLEALADTVASVPDRTLVVFLGDNIYERGLPPEGPGRAEAERRLRTLIATLGDRARGLFVPGNHDWDESGPDGYQAVIRQARLVTESDPSRLLWLPEGGCPGPALVPDLAGVSVVALDTQWWLHKYAKPTTACTAGDTEAVARGLESMLAEAAGDVVVVAHHPLQSTGRHADDASWKDHLFPLRNARARSWFPLPVLGSLYYWIFKPLTRTEQSLQHSKNREMRTVLDAAMASSRPLVYAAGHDHSLQVFEGAGSARYVLVSGAGSVSKVTPVDKNDQTLFADARPGFMVLDFMTDDSVLLRVVQPGRGVVFSRWLRPPPS
ncbi:MAG: metallophosphoesterase [Longimicrobiales bacterium]